jgi:ribosomal protein S6
MFLFDPAQAAQWETVEKEIGRIMQRAGAELIGIKKWDERRLAYEIKHRKRACYALTFFRSPRSNLTAIERDARLSETILRLLVLKCDLTDEQLAEFGKEAAEQSAFLRAGPPKAAKPAEEGQPEPRAETVEVPAAEAGPAPDALPTEGLKEVRAEGGEEVSREEAQALWGGDGEGSKTPRGE